MGAPPLTLLLGRGWGLDYHLGRPCSAVFAMRFSSSRDAPPGACTDIPYITEVRNRARSVAFTSCERSPSALARLNLWIRSLSAELRWEIKSCRTHSAFVPHASAPCTAQDSRERHQSRHCDNRRRGFRGHARKRLPQRRRSTYPARPNWSGRGRRAGRRFPCLSGIILDHRGNLGDSGRLELSKRDSNQIPDPCPGLETDRDEFDYSPPNV